MWSTKKSQPHKRVPPVRNLLATVALSGFLAGVWLPVSAQTPVSGNQSGVWNLAGSPYLVTGDVFIPFGQTLTIEPGTTIQFEQPYYGLLVDGTLVAQGTPANPILFTSDKAVKAPGQWEAIYFRDTSDDTNCVMSNCVIECGGATAYAGESIQILSASPTITNCTVRYSQTRGVTLYTADPRIENCAFQTNGGYALGMTSDSLPRLRNNTAIGNTNNAHAVFGGSFSRTGMWTRDTIPYTIINDLYIANGRTLTLEPGTTIQFEQPYYGLLVDGTLVAQGTPANPILFTSAEAVKAPGQWKAISFSDTSDDANCLLQNCVIEYAGGSSVDGSLILLSASPTVRDRTIRFGAGDGVTASASTALLRALALLGNGRDGLRAVNGSVPSIINSVIAGNTNLGVNNFVTTQILNAEGNYWGHSSGPFDNANTDGLGLLNPSGLGDRVSEYVDWSPFLGSSPLPEPAPTLAITRSGNNVLVTWPTNHTGFRLQSTLSLNPPISWITISNVPIAGASYEATVGVTNGSRFFQLVKP